MAEKKCPDCAKMVQADAKVCRYCGLRFDGAGKTGTIVPPLPPTDPRSPNAKKPSNTGRNIGFALGVILLVAMLGQLDKSNTPVSGNTTTGNEIAAVDTDKVKAAEDRRNGFHCLSGWDGSNRSAVTQLKETLREPDSFEHVETRIAPATKGAHALMMKYRARNGFGGMNVGTLLATIDANTCNATIIANDSK